MEGAGRKVCGEVRRDVVGKSRGEVWGMVLAGGDGKVNGMGMRWVGVQSLLGVLDRSGHGVLHLTFGGGLGIALGIRVALFVFACKCV